MRMWTQGDRSEVGLKPANKAQASKPHKQVDEETDTEVQWTEASTEPSVQEALNSLKDLFVLKIYD